MHRAALACLTILPLAAQPVRLAINAPIVTHTIDSRIYGVAVDRGIWGETVRNGGFEEKRTTGAWRFTDGVLECLSEGVFRLDEVAWNYNETTVEVWRGKGATALVANLTLGEELPAGQWHTVRVRVEDGRTQAWVDGQRRDVAGAASRLSLGARGGAVRFRGVKLIEPLGQGFAACIVLPAIDWCALGPVEIASEQSLHLVTRGGDAPAGIEQYGVSVRAGDTLHGWLRMSGAGGGVAVRMVRGSEVLAAQELAAAASKPGEYRLALTPSATAESAVLQVLFHGASDVTVDRLSLMPDSARANGGYRARFFEALAALRPPMLWCTRVKLRDGFGQREFETLADKLKSVPALDAAATEWSAPAAIDAGAALNRMERDARLKMAAGAVLDFRKPEWAPTPAYAVMKLYRESFASDVVQMTGDVAMVDAIATRTPDGGRICLKVVNRKPAPIEIEAGVRGDFPIANAEMQVVTEEATRAAAGAVERDGLTVRFRVPATSVAVVTMRR
jgi:hypothetical protein